MAELLLGRLNMDVRTPACMAGQAWQLSVLNT